MSTAKARKAAELAKAAWLIRGEPRSCAGSGYYSDQDLEQMLTRVCGQAETLTEDNAATTERWL